ncbi:MAG: histidine kinase, partial [Bacteroidota bacterium]
MGNQDISTPIRQKVFELSRQYINNYRNRHGFVKVLGMSQPTSIESIYTKVKLLDAQTTRSFDTAETLETFYRQAKERSFKFRRNNQYSDFEVANQAKFLTVLGEPGSGKSTFL